MVNQNKNELYLKILDLKNKGFSHRAVQKSLHCRYDNILYAVKNKEKILNPNEIKRKYKKKTVYYCVICNNPIDIIDDFCGNCQYISILKVIANEIRENSESTFIYSVKKNNKCIKVFYNNKDGTFISKNGEVFTRNISGSLEYEISIEKSFIIAKSLLDTPKSKYESLDITEKEILLQVLDVWCDNDLENWIVKSKEDWIELKENNVKIKETSKVKSHNSMLNTLDLMSKDLQEICGYTKEMSEKQAIFLLNIPIDKYPLIPEKEGKIMKKYFKEN